MQKTLLTIKRKAIAIKRTHSNNGKNRMNSTK